MMDEKQTPERVPWFAFRFKDGFTDVAESYTPEKMARTIREHGALVGIAPA